MATTPTPTNPLPTLATPSGPLGRMAAAVAAHNRLPVELTTVVALGVLSAATRGRWRVRLLPGSSGWTESLALYAAGVAGSGTGKSSALRALTTPIVERERELMIETSATYAAAVADREVATRRLNAAMKVATYGSDAERGPAVKEAVAIRRQMDAVGQPHRVELWFEDVTPEYLPTLLASQGGASAHFGDGGILDAAARRRSAWGDQAGLDILLKAYNGGRLQIDRIDEFGGTELVLLAEPFLAIAMLADPETMAEAMQDPAFHGRGLLARFLFAAARPVVGTREIDPPPVPDEVAAEWDRTVRGVLDAALAAEAVTTLELTPDADEVFTAFRADWEPRLHPETGDLADIPAWASKHPGKVARIASLLALAQDPATTTVGVEHVWAAVNLAEVHAEHARAALTGVGVAGVAA